MECARRGRGALVAGCVELLTGGSGTGAWLSGSAADATLVVALGGAHARQVLAGGPRPDQQYWLRVWAARGLLWAWEDHGLPGVRAGLGDPAWRVREMAAKVVARHLLGDLLPEVAELRGDAVPRVRSAAVRAVARLTRSGA